MQSSRLALGLLASALITYGQSPLGTVTGLVVDPSGASVPKATVKLKNAATNIEARAESNDAGVYLFANILPGDYELRVEAKGFRALATSAFNVAAYRTIRKDLNVEVGETVNTVEVRGEVATVVQYESPSIATSLSMKQVRELPTNLRSVFNNAGDSGLIFQMMPLTVPGLVQVGAGAAWITPGAGANGVKTKVDGIDTNFGNFGTIMLLDAGTIQLGAAGGTALSQVIVTNAANALIQAGGNDGSTPFTYIFGGLRTNFGIIIAGSPLEWLYHER